MTDLAPSRSSPAARNWLAWSGCCGAASTGTASCKRPPQPQRALTGACPSLACGRLRTCIAVMLCRLPERRIGRQSHMRNRQTRHTAGRRAGRSKRPRLSRPGAGALCRRRRTWTPGATPGRTGRTGSVPAAAALPRPRRRPAPARSCRRPRHTAAGRAAQSARSVVSRVKPDMSKLRRAYFGRSELGRKQKDLGSQPCFFAHRSARRASLGQRGRAGGVSSGLGSSVRFPEPAALAALGRCSWAARMGGRPRAPCRCRACSSGRSGCVPGQHCRCGWQANGRAGPGEGCLSRREQRPGSD